MLGSDCSTARLRLLIGMVADSRKATRDRLLTSMRACDATSGSGWKLDWTVVAYDDNTAAWQTVIAAAQRFAHVRLTAVLGRGNHSTRAVHVHRKRILDLSLLKGAQYDFIWFLDGDISLAHVNLAGFMHRLLCPDPCGRLPSGPPLVAQPTIEPATQLWGLNHAYWNESLLLSVRTRFVEQQAPLFDGRFLRWLYDQPVVRRILDLQDLHGTSWGMDAIWCGAASAYATTEHRRSRVPCAVLVQPVHHDHATHDMPHDLVAKGGLRLLREARLIPNRCTNESCQVHPWFYLPGADFKKLARYNRALKAGWVGSGCLTGRLHADSAVRARKWRARGM